VNLRIRYSTDKGKTWSGWTDATLELAIRVAQQKGHRVETEDDEITAKIERHISHRCASGDGRKVPKNADYDAVCDKCDPAECPLENVAGGVIDSLSINNDAEDGHSGEVSINMDDGRMLVLRSFAAGYNGETGISATLYDEDGRYSSGDKE
jgi:hypothetical protein